jgi:hypothetical protein
LKTSKTLASDAWRFIMEKAGITAPVSVSANIIDEHSRATMTFTSLFQTFPKRQPAAKIHDD